MPPQEVLIMAVTRMLAGVCTAGFVKQPAPSGRIAWVRPVKVHANLLLGDLEDARGRIIQCCDVVALRLGAIRSDPPHIEDRICDFVYHRPRLLRRLEGEHRARFLAAHLDHAPQEVLGPEPSRSLCLIRPDRLWASFHCDAYSRKYETRIGFTLNGLDYPAANARGMAVTDLKWRALGREWLADGGRLTLEYDPLLERLGASEIYLAIGLSRPFQGIAWPLVIGVHTVPDCPATIDYGDL
jgi:hypothetical protein